MTKYKEVEAALAASPRRWLVTGAAGFIGSHLVERLLDLGHSVVGVDDFSTGRRWVIDQLKGRPDEDRFVFVEGDVAERDTALRVSEGVDFILHQAALGSVPRSLSNPIASHTANVNGFLQIAIAARDVGARRLVFASSSSVYGDHPALPKHEDFVGRPLSPYAATKRINELYADVLSRAYGLSVVGLRYFNVFGPRQDPDGPYAAVVPRWITAMLEGEPCTIYGDGATSRDFCYIENVVQANLLSALATDDELAADRVFNIACGERTTLAQLHEWIAAEVADLGESQESPTIWKPFREGDIRHSLADIDRARGCLGYVPIVGVREGIRQTVAWYAREGMEHHGIGVRDSRSVRGGT
jgi:UDP-N-acetylglucosamine 4-epimerase